MSAPLNVDPAQLHAASGLTAESARDLQRELEQLVHRWEDLSSTWDGVASRAFGPEFDEWREGAQKTIAALDSASVTLAQHGYAFAESEAISAQNISGE
ncbi:Fis family transcriptional regulator [Mycobacteroides abscessus subsp. abscessus]|uniref:WXG100 family type VII secretion target n=1 Tax=Mycobacteroides abscessus TaxID=36809 RepID=UPI0009263492|nr:WXG100 family type VII secretion target [Mycobacteroides abscessus]QST89589.1 WXG motif protein [Mycobacterium phage prophiGD36-2]MBN7310697.1 WXG100 family type VII secretion target [Mycobacteroides abscessus subsp. abscessus]MBN7510190.1 WXG100 family type VII secretion target [Mycobacteroides abscessus subsp. massiliense]SHY61314.1 Fis family transcriptional regulator [Mycobacteroides abscessus subsp. abscessus]SIA42983.1 Fis family transcriptional regulator [Mycobacteroides abscessus su